MSEMCLDGCPRCTHACQRAGAPLWQKMRKSQQATASTAAPQTVESLCYVLFFGVPQQAAHVNCAHRVCGVASASGGWSGAAPVATAAAALAPRRRHVCVLGLLES